MCPPTRGGCGTSVGDGILRSVEDSLERTGLDRFDILYLHDPDDHFEQASTEGIGASSNSATRVWYAPSARG